MPISRQDVETVRVFVATWNLGGKSPHNGVNLDDFLQLYDQPDLVVLGFQEIVPLNAGNVLVMEDNGPAAKWLSLISQCLNKSPNGVFNTSSSSLGSLSLSTATGRSLLYQKTSLRTPSRRHLRSCNCSTSQPEKKYYSSKDSACFGCQQSPAGEDDNSMEDDDYGPESSMFSELIPRMKYSLVARKQMVGIFLTVWAKKELLQHIGHLRISCVSRGIMGCLGNKGCIAVSMSLHQTTLCFICSHLASGEKEGDELRRNSDVLEILKNTQFPKTHKAPHCRIPEKILQHDQAIWLGDLNYRIALSYSETRKLVKQEDWDSLLRRDQLKMEREAGRVFKGWKEGKIYFAPTYKYCYDSDTYAGEISKSKAKRRTPAWCDRILWHGNGIQQLCYVRRECRFSDHRPVCATFLVDVFLPID
ncbi:type I inositol polyphosphate 5-phosphatase 10 isoform X2 [Diospyros lotus]|uniref:type I inositol polyphosphate 5-phosphatase 10 isoform X2 n=2 Tax=Diospyros lotus TaxID=55363 RepID=UPI002251F728|nr:type I inositol polyphosphate 5-phosphatase 10 isoform X2 [Diospyros lotus]